MSIFWLTLYITCHTTVKRNVWDYCIENTELDIIFTHVRYQLPHMILHVTCLYLTYLISIQHRLIITINQGRGIQNRQGVEESGAEDNIIFDQNRLWICTSKQILSFLFFSWLHNRWIVSQSFSVMELNWKVAV